MAMTDEPLTARLETVRMKIRRWRRTVQRRTVAGAAQSNNHTKALAELHTYDAEERHLVSLLAGPHG